MIRPLRIEIADGRIVRTGDPVGDADIVVDDEYVIAPGLIDLQINGAFGHDFTEDPTSITDVSRRLPSTGVTAFLPTIVTSNPACAVEADEVLRSVQGTWPGAVPLGLHLEGPVISPDRRGTHPIEWIEDDPARFAAGLGSLPTTRLVTYAPECDPDGELADRLATLGIVAAIGHSDATFAEARAAIDDGAALVTHLFNGMAPLHHRSPGIIGAALTHPHVAIGLIADGVHVAPAVIDIAWQLTGPGRAVVVSDAIAAMGLGDGTFALGSVEVVVVDGVARNRSGGLAGSACPLLGGLRNLVEWGTADIGHAIQAGSRTPARALGLTDRGAIEPRHVADLVIVSDDMTCVATMVAGRLAHDQLGVFAGTDLRLEPLPTESHTG